MALAAVGTGPQHQGEETTLVVAHWAFAGVGLAPGERWLAEAPAPGTEGEPTHAH